MNGQNFCGNTSRFFFHEMIAEPEGDVTVPRSVRVVWTWLDCGFVPTGPRSPTTDLGPVLMSAHPGAKQRPASNACVKSTSPTTENWLRKLCTYSMKHNMSDEDNKHDTNYINKYNDANTDTRKLHL